MTDAATAGTTALTSYVGRAVESREVRKLLRSARLVTLTGPGGVGKTRLAQQIQADIAERYDDGTIMVALDDLDNPDLVPSVIAERLGLFDHSQPTPTDTVVTFLQGREFLLLLDNCEHLAEACAEIVDRLLGRCPSLTVLATSRQSLGPQGERVLPLGPMSLPDDGAARNPTEYDAVRLFVDRAEAAFPAFQLTDANAADIVRVCRRLDGLPLAIELAARRIRALSPAEIADRLDRSLSILTTNAATVPERQHGLRAAIDGSHALCSPTEQAVWAQLSVFAGGFELEAAEYVCAGEEISSDDVLDAIDGLLDKSVLTRHETAEPAQYRLLESLRQYGAEQLAANGDPEGTARRHRDYYADLLERIDAAWFGPDQATWAERLRRSRANIRAALDWSLNREGEGLTALQMALLHFEPLLWAGLPREGRIWLDRALGAVPAHAEGRARALAAAGLCALFHGDIAAARERIAEAEELDDPDALPFIRHAQAFAKMLQVEPGTLELAAESVRLFAERGDVRHRMHPLFIQGIAATYRGDAEHGRALEAQMAELAEAAGSRQDISTAHFGRAVVAIMSGNVEEAKAANRKALLTAEGMRRPYVVEMEAWVATKMGRLDRAATLFGAASALWDRVGTSADVATPLQHQMLYAEAREAKGAASFDSAYARGRRMSEPIAMQHALDEVVANPDGSLDPLTRRESEIALLVTEGLTSQDIADRLVISRRTVETHVQHVLTKLDLSNRAQIASWITERRPVVASE